MNKIALYILLILIFLGASRSFTPESKARQYIYDESNYSELFKGNPVSVVLLDAFRAGFAIKSNIHKYKVIRIFGGSEIVTLRVSRKYFRKTLPYIGLSLFRRDENNRESTLPLPPGSMFIADPGYGKWIWSKSGEKEWQFYRAYGSLKDKFHWGEWVPTYNFYRTMKIHIKEGVHYTGLNKEFGSDGELTRKMLPMTWYKSRNKRFAFKDYLETMTKIPFIRNN